MKNLISNVVENVKGCTAELKNKAMFELNAFIQLWWVYLVALLVCSAIGSCILGSIK